MKAKYRMGLLIAGAAWVLLCATTGAWEPGPNDASYQDISTTQARAMLNSDPYVLPLDVREVSEFDAGHIPDAWNLPWNSGALQALHGELPTSPIIVYCRSGGRSAPASQFLVDNDHSDIFNMLGGYLAWVALPTPTPSPTPTPTPSPVPRRAVIDCLLGLAVVPPDRVDELDPNGNWLLDVGDVVLFSAEASTTATLSTGRKRPVRGGAGQRHGSTAAMGAHPLPAIGAR